jgi:hypothetical protein
MPENWKKNWLLQSPNGFIKYDNIFNDDYKKSNPLWVIIPSREGLLDDTLLSAFELSLERKAVLQNIGNLTVITGKLNSSISDSSYDEKKLSILINSTLMLNKDICLCDSWDVEQIANRSKILYESFCNLWPDVNWFINDYNKKVIKKHSINLELIDV